jgi:two-component system, LytTR family, response regulator
MPLPNQQPIRAIIVDDEPLSREIIREFLAAYAGIEMIAECGNGYEAIKVIAEQKPDLIFLDIQMPKLSGFDVLELIEHPVNVIFITAYDQYAIKAFEVHALDYLLKPVSRERFDEAVTRVLGHIRSDQKPLSPSIPPIRTIEQKYLTRILIKDGSDIHIIAVSEIDYIEAQDDYICVYSKKDKYLKNQRLNELEQSLDPDTFVRIHRSYILNIHRLSKIDLLTKDSRVAVLKDGKSLPISRSGYERLKGLIK